MSQADPESTANTLARKLWWALPSALFLLVIGVGMVVGGAQEPAGAGTSYDVSPSGYRAAYLLLDELGYPVVRSRRPTGGSVRLALGPRGEPSEVQALRGWVEEGGILILADEGTDLARPFGLKLKAEPLNEQGDPEAQARPDAPSPTEHAASGLGVTRLDGGSVAVTAEPEPARVLAHMGKEPVVSAYSVGLGELWLVNRPQLFTNGMIGKAQNATFLCRLVEAAAAASKNEGPIAFDEFVHGLRERPGFVQLLLQPPTLWLTLQWALVTAVAIWHFAPRFGTLRPIRLRSRRSKEEFLDAMASLLDQKGDAADAYRTVRQDLAHRLERELGLPAGTPPEVLAREAARRRGVDEDDLFRLLTTDLVPAEGGGRARFLKMMNALETTYDELIDRSRRNPR